MTFKDRYGELVYGVKRPKYSGYPSKRICGLFGCDGKVVYHGEKTGPDNRMRSLFICKKCGCEEYQ